MDKIKLEAASKTATLVLSPIVALLGVAFGVCKLMFWHKASNDDKIKMIK